MVFTDYICGVNALGRPKLTASSPVLMDPQKSSGGNRTAVLLLLKEEV